MYKARDLVLLRQWYFDESDVFDLDDVKEVFQKGLEDAEYDTIIVDDEIAVGNVFNSSTLPVFWIKSTNNPNYMDILVCSYKDKKIPLIEMATIGKGQQIKDVELAGLFIKTSAVKDFISTVSMGSAVAKRMTGHGVAGAVGAGVTAAVSGGFRLATKGVKALMRDQEAYDKEMGFYMSIINLADNCIAQDNITALRDVIFITGIIDERSLEFSHDIIRAFFATKFIVSNRGNDRVIKKASVGEM